MEAYWGGEVQLHAFFTSALNGGKWSVSFTPRPLYCLGKTPRYPLGKRLSGPQSRSERGGQEYPFFTSAGNGTPEVQSVAQSLY